MRIHALSSLLLLVSANAGSAPAIAIAAAAAASVIELPPIPDALAPHESQAQEAVEVWDKQILGPNRGVLVLPPIRDPYAPHAVVVNASTWPSSTEVARGH